MRAGDSLVIALRPTGLSDSSPSSEKKFQAISHHGLTRSAGSVSDGRARGQHQQECQPHEQQAEPELGRAPTAPGCPSADPQPGEDRRQDDDEEGLQRPGTRRSGNSKPNRRRSVLRSAKSASDDPACLVAGPEQDGEQEQHDDGADPPPFGAGEPQNPAGLHEAAAVHLRRRRTARRARFGGHPVEGRLQVSLVRRRTGPGRAPCPRRRIRSPGASRCAARCSRRRSGPSMRAGVDAHVEDREAGIAPRVARLVERADQRAHAWLQQAGADHDQRRGPIEEGQGRRHQREVAQHDQDAAVEDAAVLAEHAGRR